MPPANDRVDVWLVPLERAVVELGDRMRLLTDAEVERARSFTSAHDAADFVMVRSTLRGLLGRRLGVPAAHVRIQEAPGRKPTLAGGGATFNVSHTRGLGVIAVAEAREVGVDVERRAPIEIARELPGFTARELHDVRAAADPVTAFYRAWTLKESLLKASGTGMGGPMPEIDIALGEQRVGGYVARALVVPSPWAAALAVECALDGPLPRVALQELSGTSAGAGRADRVAARGQSRGTS